MLKKYIAYAKDNPEGYWFKRKCYGWGWTPVTWQGFAVVIAYLVVVLWFVNGADIMFLSIENIIPAVSPVIVATIMLIVICYQKGESPKWQWGIPEKK